MNVFIHDRAKVRFEEQSRKASAMVTRISPDP